jgi:hypothetical protein
MSGIEIAKVDGFPLFIARDGRVLKAVDGKELKPSPDRHGYPRVYAVDNNGKRRGLYVHRLLATAFIPNPGKPHVNHKDGNKGNFALENLEWCTHGENMAHAKNTGLWTKEMGREKFGPRNEIIRRLHKLGVKRAIIAEAFGMNAPATNQIIRNGERLQKL